MLLCKLNNMIYMNEIVNICMSDILACVECWYAIALHLGGDPSREIPLLAFLTPSWDPFQVSKTHLGM